MTMPDQAPQTLDPNGFELQDDGTVTSASPDVQGEDELDKILQPIRDYADIVEIDRAEMAIRTLISTQREQARQEGRSEVLDALEKYAESSEMFGIRLDAVEGFIAAQRKEDKKGD